jgi:RecB family exonuclease
VDRVDVLADGSLVVIDFKTGKPTSYEQKGEEGPFRGGRLLQAAVYAAAVEARRLGHVCRFEYRFPTPRGENRVVAYDPGEISAGRRLVTELLDHAARGEFVPTNDAHDCSYCDYQPVCRAARGPWNATTSPRAEWGATHGPAHEAYRSMIARRDPAGGFEPEGDE